MTVTTTGLCECGCGGKVNFGKRFLPGHNSRLVPPHFIKREIRTCACGCGATFECKVNSSQQFLKGHYAKANKEKMVQIGKKGRGRKQSKEHIRRRVEARKRNGAYVGWQGRAGKTLEKEYGAVRAKEIKAKQSKAQKNRKDLPERMRKNRKNGTVYTWNKGETKETNSKVLALAVLAKQRMLLPQYSEQSRKRMIKTLTEGKIPQTDTMPHRMLRKAMQENSLWGGFQDEFPFKWGSIDIANPEKKIAIYVDGNYWHNYPTGTKTDKSHTSFLTNRGWVVLRFWESNIKKDLVKCLTSIKEVL